MKDMDKGASMLLVESLQRLNPHLLPAQGPDSTIGIQNLRRALEGEFPGCSIRVGAMHGPARGVCGPPAAVVRWKDGPSAFEVEQVAARFTRQAGVEECESGAAAQSAWSKAFGAVGRVVFRRTVSQRVAASMLAQLAISFGRPFSQMAPYVTGGEIPMAANRFMKERVRVANRDLEAGTIFALMVRNSRALTPAN